MLGAIVLGALAPSQDGLLLLPKHQRNVAILCHGTGVLGMHAGMISPCKPLHGHPSAVHTLAEQCCWTRNVLPRSMGPASHQVWRAVQVDVAAHDYHTFYSDEPEAAPYKPTTPELISYTPTTPGLPTHKPAAPELTSHKPKMPELISHRPNTPSSEHHTWDNGSFSTLRDDLSSVASYERGASSDAEASDASATIVAGAPKVPGEPGAEPKKKRRGLKKLGKGLKKAFVEPFEKMSSRSSSRATSPRKNA